MIAHRPDVSELQAEPRHQRWHCNPVAATVSAAGLRVLLAIAGYCLLASTSTIVAGEPAPRALNNLVSELLDCTEGQLAKQTSIEFTNPREGWCHFSVHGAARLRLNSESASQLSAIHADGSAEAMRRLPAGRHTLHIVGRPTRLTVRAVPALQYAFYDGGNLWTLEDEAYSWEFLSREVLPQINVMISAGSVNPLHLQEWTDSGRRWIESATVPGSGREDVTADEVYETWASRPGLTDPLMDGIIVDEFPGGDQPKYDAYRAAAERVATDARFKGKSISPYSCGGGGILSGYTGTDRCQQFARACLAGGGQIAIERYLVERPTEAAARQQLEDELISGWNMGRFEQDFPGIASHSVIVLGYMSAVGESLNIDPGVDFKVHLDMQMQLLATAPAYAQLGGIQCYHSGYADVETVRWAARLFRHYAVEGKTSLLSGDLGFKYRPEIVRNPDFAEGLAGWTIDAAVPASVSVEEHAGYGYLQFRYAVDGTGDRFLLTRRSLERPNVFRQELRNLVPGRLYSLKLVTSDYQDLRAGRSDPQQHAIRIELENVEIPSGNASRQTVFSSHYARPVAGFENGRTFPMNAHWRLFRAKANTSTLSIFDWQTETEAGGPADQELAFNFIEVQPFFE